MARITLFPGDGHGNVDNNLAKGIDYTGIDPTIHCVQWFDDYGWIEYDADLITGVKPENVMIDSIDDFQPYVDQCNEIIYAANNPLICYATRRLLYGDWSYAFSAPIEIFTPNPVMPDGATLLPPPTPEDFQILFWYDDAQNWVISPFDPALSLNQAKETCTNLVKTSGAEQVNYQSRIYSDLELITNGDPGSLPTADYFGLTLATYQTYIDGQVANLLATVNAATTNSDLYQFDWRVNGDPNS